MPRCVRNSTAGPLREALPELPPNGRADCGSEITSGSDVCGPSLRQNQTRYHMVGPQGVASERRDVRRRGPSRGTRGLPLRVYVDVEIGDIGKTFGDDSDLELPISSHMKFDSLNAVVAVRQALRNARLTIEPVAVLPHPAIER